MFIYFAWYLRLHRSLTMKIGDMTAVTYIPTGRFDRPKCNLYRVHILVLVTDNCPTFGQFKYYLVDQHMTISTLDLP